MSFDEECKKAVDKGNEFAFIPRRLGVEGLPEYSNMPFNVMFSSFTVKDGVTVMGSALYEPNFSTFKKEDDIYSMEYRNKYGGDCWLRVSYNNQKNSWHGDKFVNGEFARGAFGLEWKAFFIHFTMLGLANGERCEFSPCP